MTSGLVVILERGLPEETQALAAIRSNPGFTVGDQNGCWLSVVLEANDSVESEYWHDWLHRLPGVEGVEVVFVHLDDAEATHVSA